MKKQELPNYIDAPVNKTDIIGHIEYHINGNTLGKSNIISEIDIDKIQYWDLFERILSKFLIKW